MSFAGLEEPSRRSLSQSGDVAAPLQLLLLADGEAERERLHDAVDGIAALQCDVRYPANDETLRAVLRTGDHAAVLVGSRAGQAMGLALLEALGAAVGSRPVVIVAERDDQAAAELTRELEIACLLHWTDLAPATVERSLRAVLRLANAERRLREAHDFCRAALDALSDHVAIVDRDGTIVEVNAAWERFAAANGGRVDAVGRGVNYFSVCERAGGSSPLAGEISAGIQEVLAEARAHFGCDYPCHAPGAERWFRLRATPFRSAGSMHVLVAHEDVTARRDAERERERLVSTLEFERNRLTALFQQAPAFVVALRGRDHVVELANEAYLQLVGFRELLGRPIAEAIPEIVSHGLVPILDQVLDTGKSFSTTAMPLLIQREPGGPPEQRFASFVYQALEEPDGSRSGILAHGVDVTDQVLASKALRESEEQHRTLVELSPDGVVVHRDGVVVLANRAAAAILGASAAEDLLGLTIATLLPDAAAAACDAAHHEGGSIASVEERLVTRDAITRDVEVASTALSLGGVPVVQTVIRDVTERRRLETQLRQSQKMEAIGRLAGGVAHDFNNLLTVITGYAMMVLTEMPEMDPLRADVVEIRQAAERAAGLTSQLLAFSRQQVLRPRVLDLRRIVGGMGAMLRRLLGEDIELTMPGGDEHAHVLADPSQIEQVVMNLVINARDAMPTGGHLAVGLDLVMLGEADGERLRGAQPGEYVRLSVRDTGCGLDEAIKSRIFEPFFTTKEAGRGTGLGLATVYGIVKQSAGCVHIESVPGAGTTFHLYLPHVLSDTEAGVDEAITVMPAAPRGETVLVVEDEDALRAVVQRVLAKRGYTVLGARSGAEALALAKRHPGVIHLLLTDIVMPQMSGQQLAERITALRGPMPVIFMTGYSTEAVTNHGVLRPGARLLVKPFTPQGLTLAVNEMLRAG